MTNDRVFACQPDELAGLFAKRAGDRDVDGMLALYEPTAVRATESGDQVSGVEALRPVLTDLLDRVGVVGGTQIPAIRTGELALTSTREASGAVTARLARLSADGTWRWVLDQPDVTARYSEVGGEDGRRLGDVAERPEDLSGLFFARANAGDVDGLVALFEPAAVSVFPDGTVFQGSAAIRESFEQLVAADLTFVPVADRPALRHGELALTNRHLPNGDVPVEVARRQSDGSWLWVLDQANILR